MKYSRNLIAFWGFISLLSCNHESLSKAGFVADKDSLEVLSTSGNRLISGVYPHLTTYAHNRVNGKYEYGNECGIGAIVPWQGKLYMVNYAAHCPRGSEHNLYIIDKDKNMEIYSGSVGGTPAARMIHMESNQLLIGHYVIDEKGNIRTIPIERMPGRITAIARHLTDPVNKVYYYDMEGMLYEADINTLEVNKLYNNPLPGWHGKGGYTAQGKLVLSNNGESDWDGFDSSNEWQVPVEGQKGPEMNGILAEYDGTKFSVVERRQFTDVTTKNGVNAIPDDSYPLWSIGWDKRSLRLKVLEKDEWRTYLLPKATFNNDPSHGWFTEWPRIREIGGGELMMDMHGMFYDFPSTFSHQNTAGIRPIASHLRYIPDFCYWNGQVILATDEVSIQGNPLSGQPQSNLWFGNKSEFYNWGPANGYGAIWLNDSVSPNKLSEPYLFAGFDNRVAHIINHGRNTVEFVIQIDKKGNDRWSDYKTIRIEGHDYHAFVIPKETDGEWIRLRSFTNGNISFVLHYSTDKYNDARNFEKEFSGLAEVGTSGNIINAKLFSNRNNYNLSCYSSSVEDGKIKGENEFEFCKYSFEFKNGISDSLASVALGNGKTEVLWDVDDASVILYTKEGKLRLPKGNPAFDKIRGARYIREVESERELANIHGTFYELPLLYVGQEPLFKMMRPVSSHNYQIDDYNTWNGLLVLSGIDKKADADNIYMNKEKTVGVWLGSIDDLWKLGKPVGVGGPWKNTDVKANVLSDPYIMTGYDKKTLSITSDKDVNVTLRLSVSHYLKDTVVYKNFDVKAGKEFIYEFPEGFSAHWAYLSSNKDCKISAQFVYE